MTRPQHRSTRSVQVAGLHLLSSGSERVRLIYIQRHGIFVGWRRENPEILRAPRLRKVAITAANLHGGGRPPSTVQ